MKMLTCKKPEMIQAERWAHLLGYNLTRCVMAQAALDQGLCPRQLSLAGAVQTLDAFRWLLSCSDQDPAVLGETLATHRVGGRPDRYEPREVKHRQRKYKELKKSRHQRRQELAESAAPPEEQAAAGKRKKGSGKDRPSGR